MMTLATVKYVIKDIFSTEMGHWKAYVKERGFVQRNPIFAVLLVVDIVLRGIAQVFLADHPISGIFIIAGLALTSTELALHAILGTFVSTVACVLLTSPQVADVFAGLCGYDGALVGCACWAFLPPKSSYINATVLSACAGMIHTGCKHLLGLANLPPFTFAFNIVMIVYLGAHAGHLVGYRFLPSGDPPVFSDDWTNMSVGFVVDASFRGVGQFMFVDTTLGGILVVIGIGISSRYGAMAALMGGFFGFIGTYYLLNAPRATYGIIRNGLFGYNCAGTCASIAGRVFYKVNATTFFLGIVAALWCSFLTAGIKGLFGSYPVLTFPFILSTWMFMLSCHNVLDIMHLRKFDVLVEHDNPNETRLHLLDSGKNNPEPDSESESEGVRNNPPNNSNPSSGVNSFPSPAQNILDVEAFSALDEMKAKPKPSPDNNLHNRHTSNKSNKVYAYTEENQLEDV